MTVVTDTKVNGTVHWFSPKLGYGFIEYDDDGNMVPIFVHYSEVQMEGYKKLKRGQEVTLTVKDTDKGMQAFGVEPIS
jgi:cold shock protein